MKSFATYLQLFFLLALFMPKLAFAIINVEQSVTDNKVDGVRHTINIDVDGAKGNTQTITLRGNLLSQWRHGKHTEFFLLNHAYGKSRGTINTDRTFIHLRHRTQINAPWAVETFAQKGRDAFTRLSDRSLLGAGIRLSAFEKEAVRVFYLGIGTFYETERFSQKSGTTDSQSSLWRGNAYAIYKHQINPQIQLSSTTYFQPSLRDSNDYRLLEEAALHIGMFENIKLKISLDYSFDSKPPQQIGKDDLLYTSGLEFRF